MTFQPPTLKVLQPAKVWYPPNSVVLMVWGKTATRCKSSFACRKEDTRMPRYHSPGDLKAAEGHKMQGCSSLQLPSFPPEPSRDPQQSMRTTLSLKIPEKLKLRTFGDLHQVDRVRALPSQRGLPRPALRQTTNCHLNAVLNLPSFDAQTARISPMAPPSLQGCSGTSQA